MIIYVNDTYFKLSFYCRLVPESIQWLVAKGRYEEAEVILQKAAAFNGISVQGKILEASGCEQNKTDEELLANSEAKQPKEILENDVITDNIGIITDTSTGLIYLHGNDISYNRLI